MFSTTDIQRLFQVTFPNQYPGERIVLAAAPMQQFLLNFRWSCVGTFSGNYIRAYGTNDDDTMVGGQIWLPLAPDEVVGNATIGSGRVNIDAAHEGAAIAIYRVLPKWLRFELVIDTAEDGTFDASCNWR